MPPAALGTSTKALVRETLMIAAIQGTSNRASPSQTWLQLTNDAGNPELNTELNTELGSAFPLQTLVNPVGTWITKSSVVRSRREIWWQAELDVMPLDSPMAGEPGFLSAPAIGS